MGLILCDWASPRGDTITCRIVSTSWGFCAYCCVGDIVTHFFLPRSSRQAVVQAIRRQLSLDSNSLSGRCPVNLDKSIRDYFSGKTVTFDCRADVSWASDFGTNVLRQCCKIKPGNVLTYGQLARQAGSPKAARAVGRILAGNPIPILIPCHRVIRADGSHGGYSGIGGESTKRKLLALETKGIDQK